MGRASRQKRERRQKRFEVAMERVGLVVDALESSPCSTCAFTDPEAWIADPEIPGKIADALKRSEPFYCHRNLETDAEGHYLEVRQANGRPDPEKMPMCAGFVRLIQTAHRDGHGKAIEAVRKLRRTLLVRAIQNPPKEPNARAVVEMCRGDVSVLEFALDATAEEKRARKEGRFACSVGEVSA